MKLKHYYNGDIAEVRALWEEVLDMSDTIDDFLFEVFGMDRAYLGSKQDSEVFCVVPGSVKLLDLLNKPLTAETISNVKKTFVGHPVFGWGVFEGDTVWVMRFDETIGGFRFSEVVFL